MALLEDNDAIAAFCERVHKESFIAVDTEFLRDKTYWPRLCLVQIAGEDGVAAIDTLAPGLDLAPVLALMSDRNILKVFHAARQDLEIFFYITGEVPAPFFDTQIAAMVCGFGEAAAFETLARKLAHAKIDKSMRLTDWSRRPLKEKQIDYALADVIYLRPVYEKLQTMLSRNGRTAWLEEELAMLADPETYRQDPEKAWLRLKHRSASPRFLSILKELAAWREREAQERDVPRNRVMRDEAVVELAVQAPGSPEDLEDSRRLHSKLAKSPSAAILRAVAAGASRPDEECPRARKRLEIPSGLKPVVELLKVLLKMKCERHGVAQKLVASSDDLERIAADDEADVAALRGWRRQIFGADALALKHGELALTTDGERVRLVSPA